MAESNPWLRNVRSEALSRFRDMGFPTTRDEEWKFTDVRPIAELDARPATDASGVADVSTHTFGGFDAHRLVFVNGHFSDELSQIGNVPDGVTVTHLAGAIANSSELVQEHLGRYASSTQDTAFIQLNTALLQDGGFVHVPGGVELERPIHLIFIGAPQDGATMASIRNLFLVGANSRVQIIEHYVGEGTYFTNTVTEVVAGKNAQVDHSKLQLESAEAFHISALQVVQERDCRFASHNIDLGGRLVRNNGVAVMGGPGIECTLNGLYLLGGDQHIDNHTVMDHAQPNCNSFEVYTGVLGGRSRGVFNGKIFVRRDAQKTDAKQSNRNLLLSNEALMNTKPQLEIFADDVRCTHGATIGQLDENALFYLRARGIDEKTARGILVYAFANDVLSGIEVEPIREFLSRELLSKLERLGVEETPVVV
jgi:Fe-S cluster assembly protein SufD